MNAAEVRRRFQAAVAGGYGADWYDSARHDRERVGDRMLNGLPAVVSSSEAQLMAEGELQARAYTDGIRATYRRRVAAERRRT